MFVHDGLCTVFREIDLYCWHKTHQFMHLKSIYGSICAISWSNGDNKHQTTLADLLLTVFNAKLGEIFLQKAMLNAPDLDIKTFLCYCILNSLMKHYCWKRQLWSSAAGPPWKLRWPPGDRKKETNKNHSQAAKVFIMVYGLKNAFQTNFE